jgi:hypothetical protein
MKKRILIIIPFSPYPILSGGHQAFFTAVDVLRFDYELYILYNKNNQNLQERRKLEILWPEVQLLGYSPKQNFQNKYDFWNRLHNKISQLFFNKYYEIAYEFKSSVCNYSNEYLDYITNIITINQIDIVQIEFMNNLSLACALPTSVKKVFVHHELRFSRHELFIKERNLTSSYYNYIYNYLKTEEIAFLSVYDAIITLSDTDKNKLQNMGVETKIFSSFAIVKKDNDKVLSVDNKCFNNYLTFVGGEQHSPNKIGLEWFLHNCWLKILENENELHLKIIGNWSIVTQKRWCIQYKNIEFLGFVNNLYSVLTGSIMIVPITIGSGVRMKILDAVNMKIPFVTTKIGVEGLPFINEVDCFISEEADDFVSKILKLKENSMLQQQFTVSAYNKINLLFTPDKLKESRINVYNDIINS